MATRERLALTSNMEKTQLFYKWPQENAWLKRAIWKTHIFNKLPEENAWLKRAIWNTEIWNTQIFNKWPQ